MFEQFQNDLRQHLVASEAVWLELWPPLCRFLTQSCLWLSSGRELLPSERGQLSQQSGDLRRRFELTIDQVSELQDMALELARSEEGREFQEWLLNSCPQHSSS